MDSILESLIYNKPNIKDLEYILNSSVEVNINEIEFTIEELEEII